MDNYEKFREMLSVHPSSAPDSKKLIEILKILFTPEEMEIAVKMSFKVKPLADLASAASLTLEDAERRLESMANKAIIYHRKKDGKNLYGLLPTIPGLFEFPFMKPDGSERLGKLGKLWEAYHKEALGNAFSGNPTPLMRVVPVEKSLATETHIHPYEEVASLIGNSQYLAVANCACRESVGRCSAPKDVCLIFDSPAQFLVERGYAKKITREEGMTVLARSEEAGLVHTSNNSADRANVICNCCPCCCTLLRGITELHNPHAIATSSYMAGVIAGSCTLCGACEDRCPVKAIQMGDETAVVDAGKCIGCGLCASACASDAIKLSKRAEDPEVPKTVQEMGLKVAKEKGTLEGFIKIMTS